MLSLICMGPKNWFNDTIYWIQIAREDDMCAQIGKDIFFDLVDHDKVWSFRIKKQMPFMSVKV